MISNQLQELLGKISFSEFTEDAGGHTNDFEVNRIISKAATVYEKARYAVDYREDHTVRRNAIERILIRKLLLEQSSDVSKSLIVELINGQYITGSSEFLELKVEAAIQKVRALLAQATKLKDKKLFISIGASEIDRMFNPYKSHVEDAVVNAFYDTVHKNLVIAHGPGEMIDTQIYSACARSLLRSDDEMLAYSLWLRMVPDWEKKAIGDMDIISLNPLRLLSKIEGNSKHTFQLEVAKKIKKETIFFSVIREVIIRFGEQSANILDEKERLESFVKEFLAKKYSIENERMRSAGIRAVIYLFFTKVILALAIEVPFDLSSYGSIHYIPLFVNIIFNPALLYFLTRGIEPLGVENTNAIIEGVQNIIRGENNKKIVIRNDHSIIATVFTSLYIFFALCVFTAIVSILRLLDFNYVSIILFIFFITLVSYFALRIRVNAERWRVVRKGGVFREMFRTVAAPIVTVGEWLSLRFSSVNVIVLVMDFIIEMPFKFVLNIGDQFISYVKRKNDEVY